MGPRAARLVGCRLACRKKPNHASCVAAANYKSIYIYYIYSLTSARPLCLDRVTSITVPGSSAAMLSFSPLGIERKKLPPGLQEAIEVVAELFRGGLQRGRLTGVTD